MGRRNRRQDLGYEPLDLTQVVPTKPASFPNETSRERAKRTAEWYERMERRQRDARANCGIDWAVCLVPGCGNELTRPMLGVPSPELRDHRERLPLCLDHLAVAAKQATWQRNDPLLVSAVAVVIERQQERERTAAEKAKATRLARTNGFIYYVRLNGLIKVGWSRDVRQRINSYGPQVEVLVVHPGTRDDETNLHRQLKPARAVGREWYEDGPILADFIAKALEQHGPPPKIETHMLKPKQVVAGKRYR